MIPALQRDNQECLSACLSSLLEIKIEDVPRFHEMDDASWWAALQDWLCSMGLQFVMVSLPENMPWFQISYSVECLLIGHTESGVNHAVVGRCEGDQFICTFDPLTGGPPRIASIEYVAFLMPRITRRFT